MQSPSFLRLPLMPLGEEAVGELRWERVSFWRTYKPASLRLVIFTLTLVC